MHFRVTLKIIGMLLMAFSTSMLPSLIIALSLPDDSSESTFALSFCITFVAGFLVWLPFSKHNNVLRTRDGFVIVVMFWSLDLFIGSRVIHHADAPGLSPTTGLRGRQASSQMPVGLH